MPVLLRFLRQETRRARIVCAYPALIKGTHKGHPYREIMPRFSNADICIPIPSSVGEGVKLKSLAYYFLPILHFPLCAFQQDA
jgi:hypothetical protein